MTGLLVYTPGLRYATLWWIWGRPGPTGGWQLRLSGAPDDQVLRPPRRGMPLHEVAAWLEEILPEHGWRRHESAPWPPAPVSPSVRTKIPVLPQDPGSAPLIP